MTVEKGLIPQFRLDMGQNNTGMITDRILGTQVTIPWDSGDVAAFCCRQGIRHLEADPTGMAMHLVQNLKAWGAIEIIENRKPLAIFTTVTLNP